jgi:two-component system NtrC family sensor kinase
MAYACKQREGVSCVGISAAQQLFAGSKPSQLVDGARLEQLAFNERMAELGRLSAALMHELNTPLSVIVSAAQMTLREDGLSDFVREMIGRIDQEAQRLSQLSRGMLCFSRRDEGGETSADLVKVLQEVMLFLRYEAQKLSVTVIEEFDYDLPQVAVSGNRIKQVMINLVMNAIQAMGSGGTLLIKAGQEESQAVITVADTGPGIAPEILPLIFEPFFTTKVPEQGTGLGLYVSSCLMEAIGGSLEVNSVVGEGTTFRVLVPLV